MDTITSTATPLGAWAQLVALLIQASRRGAGVDVDPVTHSLSLGAELVACAAAPLLPDHLDPEGDLVLGPATTTWSVVELIRAAEQAARLHPIEQFPPGASGVIVALGDLVREART